MPKRQVTYFFASVFLGEFRQRRIRLTCTTPRERQESNGMARQLVVHEFRGLARTSSCLGRRVLDKINTILNLPSRSPLVIGTRSMAAWRLSNINLFSWNPSVGFPEAASWSPINHMMTRSLDKLGLELAVQGIPRSRRFVDSGLWIVPS